MTTSPFRAIRLRHHQSQLIAAAEQRPQGRGRKIRCTHEDEPQLLASL